MTHYYWQMHFMACVRLIFIITLHTSHTQPKGQVLEITHPKQIMSIEKAQFHRA